jgi:hypothetical protein
LASTREARERARQLCSRLESHLTVQQIKSAATRAATSSFEAAVENVLRS